MHMNHVFDRNSFRDVCNAFMLKYNATNKWCTTTVCHVEQIDENRFAFVRRLENIISSQPLYERIVVDRTSMELKGYTFEKKTDEAYSEHFVYQEQADKSVTYNFYMFRDPGLKRILRYRMFNWGISNLKSIMTAQEKLRQKQLEAKQKLIASKEAIKEKALQKIEAVKTLKRQPLQTNSTPSDSASRKL